jgi:hypothetical protein
VKCCGDRVASSGIKLRAKKMAVRVRGMLYLIVGGGVFALIAYWIANPESYPFSVYPAGIGGAVAIGAPGAAAIIGLIELVSGKPFYEIEDAWASLSGLQRFFGGTVIVLVGGAVVFTAIAAALL